jgi:hypothetical protein
MYGGHGCSINEQEPQQIFFVQYEFSISFLGSFAKFQNATISFAGTVRLSARNDPVPTGWIFMKFNTEVLFQSLSRKFQVSLKSDKHFT